MNTLLLVQLLLPYVLVVVIALVALGLFCGLNQRVHKLRNGVARCEASIQETSAELANGILQLKRKMTEWGVSESTPASGASAVRGAAMDNAIRGKVLRMHRSGQSRESIADALRIPTGEVDLLVKVHRIVMEPYQEASAQTLLQRTT